MSVPMSDRSEFDSTFPPNSVVIFQWFHRPHSADYTMFNQSIALTSLPYLQISQNFCLEKLPLFNSNIHTYTGRSYKEHSVML